MMGDNAALNTMAISLVNIARELGRLSSAANQIIALEAEIVLDIHMRRAAERASYAAYHQAASAAETATLTDGKNVLPEEMPA